ncbi:baseplate J/gp47 family protein [Alkalimonas sp. NCh-2]|uniref:baseplate J/gp47 family protein n=1 Tax=Alkalimonas sp. NCh-2 TaxID=3144846 RepID=UPI0031F6BC18
MADRIKVPTIDFKRIVEDAGIPTTEEGWKELFKQDVEAEGSIIANDSAYSPFWRLISAIVAKPANWIVNKVLVGIILPNLFLQTANDDQFIEAKAWEHDLTRKEASKAEGKLQFHRAASMGPSLLIPAGTVVQTDAINGTIYRVISTTDVIMPTNITTVDVPVIAENAGADYNLGAGYFHVLAQGVTGIGSVTNGADWLDVLGSDRESNDNLKLRTRNAFTAVSAWHIDAVYRAILTQRAGLNTNNIYFEHDAPRGPGTANAYILLDTGEPSAELLADLNQYLMEQGNHGHGDDMLVMAMPGVDVAAGVTVYPYSNMLEEEVTELLAAVENFIRCAFRENTNYTATKTAPFTRFSFSRLGKELHREFEGIESLNWHQADITSANNVPRLTTLSIVNGNEP